jgi:hypothetical protein
MRILNVQSQSYLVNLYPATPRSIFATACSKVYKAPQFACVPLSTYYLFNNSPYKNQRIPTLEKQASQERHNKHNSRSKKYKLNNTRSFNIIISHKLQNKQLNNMALFPTCGQGGYNGSCTKCGMGGGFCN